MLTDVMQGCTKHTLYARNTNLTKGYFLTTQTQLYALFLGKPTLHTSVSNSNMYTYLPCPSQIMLENK